MKNHKNDFFNLIRAFRNLLIFLLNRMNIPNDKPNEIIIKGDKEIPIEGPQNRKEVYYDIIVFLKSKLNSALKLNEELLGRFPV